MGYQLKNTVNLIELLSRLDINPNQSAQGIEINNVAAANDIEVNSLSFTKTPLLDDVCCVVFIGEGQVLPDHTRCQYIVSNNPRLDFIRALNYLYHNVGFTHFDFDSEVHPSVAMGQNVVIERGCKVAEGVILEHNVVIHSGTIVGKNSRIRANSSIGGDGFGFERLPDGTPIRFPHLGGVEIGENVELGSINSVARGTLSNTIIGNNVKTDNLVHIAHNCNIGEGTFITACAELSGGVSTGKNVWIGPNSSLMQKIHIGENALLGLGSVVTKTVPEGSVFAGNPAKFIRHI